MLLYLSRNETINLLDSITKEQSIHVTKLVGNFSLQEFIVRDMRKYSMCQYFCIDRLAINEKDSDFIEAIKSFKMMYSARIIAIVDSINEFDGFVRDLIHNGVTDIVTAKDMSDKLKQISECLSDGGMLKYKPNIATSVASIIEEKEECAETIAQKIIIKGLENEEYRFDCINVRIAVAGATRRVGTTTFALGLANWLNAHGGTVCYVALNGHCHLDFISSSYDFESEENYYTHDGIDYYEAEIPENQYNFIIYDFGAIGKENAKKYKECDIYLFCGANGYMHEVMDFADGLKLVKSVKPNIITLRPNNKYEQIFYDAISKNPVVINLPTNMLDYTTNQLIYKQFIENYIVETKKRF